MANENDTEASGAAIRSAPHYMELNWRRLIGVSVGVVLLLVAGIIALANQNEIANYIRGKDYRPSVQIFLHATPLYLAPPEGDGIKEVDIKGYVTVMGRPLEDATVSITVEDVISQFYLGGGVLTTDEKGSFSLEKLLLFRDPRTTRSSSVNIRATVSGLYETVPAGGATESTPAEAKPVRGTAEVNIGFPRVVGRTIAWAIAAIVIVVALSLIFLFTGTIHAKKQRALYGAMYFLVFVSLALPIVVSMMLLQSSYLIAIMEKAPVGLVRATAASSKTEPQWFINIGGILTQKDEVSTSPRSAPASKPEAGPSAPAQPEKKSGAAPAGGETAGGAQKTPPPAQTADKPSTTATSPLEISSSSRSSPYIEGGLAVPFYVVLLAMFGAGINLTRRVPEIQEEFRNSAPPSRPFPAWAHKLPEESLQPDEEQQRQTFAFRRALIQNFMYVLSAPFLAMAVYYLLQVVAAEPARPVLVLVAFATGLISDTLIQRIVRFAEETLKLGPKDKSVATINATNAQIDKINAMMRDEEAKLAESVYCAKVARAREQVTRALKDPTLELPEVPKFTPLCHVKPPVCTTEDAAGGEDQPAADGAAGAGSGAGTAEENKAASPGTDTGTKQK